MGCYAPKAKPTKAKHLSDQANKGQANKGQRAAGWLDDEQDEHDDQSTAGYSGWRKSGCGDEQWQDDDSWGCWNHSGKATTSSSCRTMTAGWHQRKSGWGDDDGWDDDDDGWGNDDGWDDDEEEHPGWRKSGWGDDKQQWQDDWGSWKHTVDHKPRPPNHPPPTHSPAATRRCIKKPKAKPAAKTMPITIMSKETREKLAETAAALEQDPRLLEDVYEELSLKWTANGGNGGNDSDDEGTEEVPSDDGYDDGGDDDHGGGGGGEDDGGGDAPGGEKRKTGVKRKRGVKHRAGKKVQFQRMMELLKSLHT